MPLRCKFLPFVFGGLIGCVFGAFLATHRLQETLLGQCELGDTLKCGHSAAPEKAGAQTLSVAGKSRAHNGDGSIYNLAARNAVQYCSISTVRLAMVSRSVRT